MAILWRRVQDGCFPTSCRGLALWVAAGATCLLFVAHLWSGAAAGDAEGVWLPEAAAAHGARCLDGSPPLYYISVGSEPDKWLIHHEGGDWCERIEETTHLGERPNWSCLNRASTPLGSSKNQASRMDLDEYGDRFTYFSRDPARNPMLHSWTHVLVRYCDGGSYSGDVPEAESPYVTGWLRSRRLYFRGKAVLQAIMTDLLEKRGLDAASSIVLGGASAGGVGILMQADEWQDRIRATATAQRRKPPKLAVMVDAGIFPDHQDASSPACRYEERLRRVMALHRPTSQALRRCQTANADDPGRCMFGVHLLPHVEAPVFAFSSVFDGWMLQHVICNTERPSIQAFGGALRQSILSVVDGTHHGAYLEDCRHHTKCWSDIAVNHTTPAEAFQQWYGALGDQSPGRVWAMTGKYGTRKCNKFFHKRSCPVTKF
eukprot:jgi/Tetstr1/465974/TSEL_010566.t1